MPMNSIADSPLQPIGMAEVDLAGEQLLGRVRTSCEPENDFGDKVEAALRGGLSLCASKPVIAHHLFAPDALPSVAERQEAWRERVGADLRQAASARGPQSPLPPPFVEPFLVLAAGVQVLRQVQLGRSKHLVEDLHQELLRLFLAYYSNPRSADSREGSL
jgi:hypothetical protein